MPSLNERRSLTILVPCYNEQESLPALFDRLLTLIRDDASNLNYTLLFVDDGSHDGTPSLIRRFAQSHRCVQYLLLSRNFGKEKAMFAGIEHIDTDGMVIIDADLQDPPELIPQMAALWRQGYDDVYARRRSRTGESLTKRITSHLYYALLQHCSSVDIQTDTGDFRLLDRKCIAALQRLDESERNSKALFSWIGFNKIEFLYDRDRRVAGSSKWDYPKLFHLAIDGIVSYTTAPLKISTIGGVVISAIAIVYALIIVARTMVNGVDVPGYASLFVAILLIGGVQLLSIGILGEYLGRVFMQTKHRPNYLIKEQSVHTTMPEPREFHETGNDEKELVRLRQFSQSLVGAEIDQTIDMSLTAEHASQRRGTPGPRIDHPSHSMVF